MHLGIDFGTSYTKLGYWKDGQFINLAGREQRIPSLVSWLPSQSCLYFGNLASRLAEPDAVRANFFKLALKRNPGFFLGSFSLSDIMREFFNFLKKTYISCSHFQFKLESISLSIPNYFGLNSRRILLEAAREAFQIEAVYLLPEPVAAISGYNLNHPENPLQGDILSIDIGGGTSDFSFLRLLQENSEILLETQLQIGNDAFSGSEIDRHILRSILYPCFRMQHGEDLPEQFWSENFSSRRDKFTFNRFMLQAEQLKIAMSHSAKLNLDIPDFYDGKSLRLELDQNIFQLQMEDSFKRLKIFFNESVKSRALSLNLYDGQEWQLDYVLLQGGASQCRGVRKLIEELCPGVKVIHPDDVDFNVVRGLSLWNKEGLAANSKVKCIFPFQFYIETLSFESHTPGLEKIRFDTANLELDIQGRYKIFSFHADSPYNLAVDTGLLSCNIYEAEEANSQVGLNRFQGQELIWHLETTLEEAPEIINIYLDMADSRLESSQLPESPAELSNALPELFNNFLRSQKQSFYWINNYPLTRPALLSDFKNQLQQQENQSEATRYKLLCLLDFLTRK